MTLITTSQLHPDQALNILKVAPTPDITVSLVEAIFSRYHELVLPQKRKLFDQLLETRYGEMLHFANSQAIPRVKRIVSRVAFSLGHEEEAIGLWYEAFLHGDIGSFFELLDFLIANNNIEKARNYISEAFNFSLRSYISAHDFSHETRTSFYDTLITYAYDLGIDSFAQEMIYMTEGKYIEPDDPRILRYKKVIRTPEEFYITLQVVWNFHAHGNMSAGISPRNIRALEGYIIGQINYLGEHEEIEPAMLRHLTEDTTINPDKKKWYDYRKIRGQLYFQMHQALLLAIIHRNPRMADAILEFIDDKGDEAVDMLADMLDSMNDPADEEPIDDDMSAEQKVCSEVLLPMLDMFQGIEHTELQERILSHMELLAPTDAKRLREIFTSRNSVRLYHLSSTGITQYYFVVCADIEKKYTPVISKNIVDAVVHGAGYPDGLGDADLMVYYLLEYMLLYGRKSTLTQYMIQVIGENMSSLSTLERDFLGQFYPEYFL